MSDTVSHVIIGFPLEEDDQLCEKIMQLRASSDLPEEQENFLWAHLFETDDTPRTILFGTNIESWYSFEDNLDVRADTQAYLQRLLVEETKSILDLNIARNCFRILGLTTLN